MNLSVPPSGHFHAVRFYEDGQGLSQIVAGFLADGLAQELPAIVIATPEHRSMIEAALARLGFDIDRLRTDGRLIVLDADQMLAEFMIDGMPNPGRFRRAITPVIEKACGGRKDCVVRAYGEMVDVLWKSGQTVAAIRVETLWNALANTHAFSLLCGYAMGNTYKHAALQEIRRHHSHVVPDAGDVLPAA